MSTWFVRLPCFLLLALLSACGSSVSDLEALHADQAGALERVADRFVAEHALRGMTIVPAYDPSLCESVNTWRRCSRSGPWDDWDIQMKRKIYLPSLEAVLLREKISAVSYDYYAHFLRTHDLNSIDQALECGECVQFESGLDGLLYTRDTTYRLVQDREYLFVKKLDNHWYVYTRDWN